MKEQLASFAGQLARLAFVAVRAWVATVLIAVFAGVAFAIAAYIALYSTEWPWRLAAGLLALIECVVVGVAFAGRRAMTTAFAEGCGSLKLGRSAVRVVFSKMLAVGSSDVTTDGGSGNSMARKLERIPVARAEEMLQRAIATVLGEPEQGGWLRRKIKKMLLETVRTYTLGRFRADGEKSGTIDLVAVQTELEATVDDMIVARILDGLFLWNAGVLVGVPVLITLQTWLISYLAHRIA